MSTQIGGRWVHYQTGLPEIDTEHHELLTAMREVGVVALTDDLDKVLNLLSIISVNLLL